MIQLRSTRFVTSYFETVEFKNKLVSAEYFKTAPNTRSRRDLCKNRLLIIDGLEEPIASYFTPN
jgi:hypothetical protein